MKGSMGFYGFRVWGAVINGVISRGAILISQNRGLRTPLYSYP